MRTHFLLRSTLLLTLLAPAVEARAADPQAEIVQIRKTLEAMKRDYTRRIAELEKRLAAVEKRAQAAERQAARAEESARAAATAPEQTESANAMNPGIGLVMNGRYQSFSRPASEDAIPGFAIGPGATKGEEGFSLGESELGISADIDDRFYGQFTASYVNDAGENSVEVEEAFIQTLALPAGLGLKAGRFLPGIGYLNSFHTHADDFADRPLPYRAMLNDADKDDGVELRWLAPTDLFLELGADLLAGDQYPGGGGAHDGVGAWAFFFHLGGDWDESNAWQAGLSYLDAEARDRVSAAGDSFSGHDRLWIVDAVWKWAPQGNPYQHNFKLQGEFFRRRESGDFTPAGAAPLPYAGDQYGWYVQAIYQFMPRWRLGLRFAGLHADDPGAALAGTALDSQGHDPRHYSAMIDWSNSEFSRLRLQYNNDRSRPRADDQFTLQYIVALGAHGAHQF